ncbi:DUF3718 domain-containing protein [Colwelliaceae bacterium BS250]
MNIRQIIATLVLTNIALFATAQDSIKYVFKGADNSLDTRMCVAAASNNLRRLKGAVRMDGYGIRYITRFLICNDQDITNFAAKYGTYNTTKYLNRYAPKKYKINSDEVEIIDLVHQSSSGQVEVIYISSK